MKVVVAFGTRPEVIKLAPVILALRGRAKTVLCATGQHSDMLREAMKAFDIVPDIELGVMTAEQSLNALASRVLGRIDAVYAEHAPDWVVVQGDTTTAFMAALAAFHRRIRVAHVEAGLRTGDLADPFPEEANRSLISRLARMHFAPTERAKRNLLADNIDPAAILVTGNTIVDAIEWMRTKAAAGGVTLTRKPSKTPLVLVTCHRREAFGDGILQLCQALARLAARYPGTRIVFPVHPNPNVHGPAYRMLGGTDNLSLIDPLPYSAMLELMAEASLIITDSGGIQEEAPSFGVPLLVIREQTERPEVVEAGFATLAGTRSEAIETAAAAWLDHPERAVHLKTLANPYGDGQAARRIVDALLSSAEGR